ncbi:Phophatidylserine decarboxylase-domain-containing protein [Trametes polyzona]|nr:Phophatidylserine decarboxylase-domain-containing protein [Trametes polyzona]
MLPASQAYLPTLLLHVVDGRVGAYKYAFVACGKRVLPTSQYSRLGDNRTYMDYIALGNRIGGWLPQPSPPLKKWLDEKIALVEHPSRRNVALHPVIQEFKDFIEADPAIHMGFHQMFEQIPSKRRYAKDPSGKPQVRDYNQMLFLFNHIIETAPVFEDSGFVGFPINAILDWPMGTPAGMVVFTNPAVNEHFKKMFDVWSTYLTSEASRTVLNDGVDGWFGPAARAALPDFESTYICDPSAPYHGFTSWDHFFTRLFRPGVRPVLFPHNSDIVNSACESAVYRLGFEAKETDEFWLKGQPYSLSDMLDHDEYAPRFAGGTVYQAYLAATSYHRWHAPVDGTISRIVHVPGTYYAESSFEGFPDPDIVAPNSSQAYITAVATRAIVFIQADNPVIGLMAFIAVGMAEVSTCEATVEEGQKVRKGDELGMFHYGGSTHCLVFGPQVAVTFAPEVEVGQQIRLNQPIATVSSAR